MINSKISIIIVTYNANATLQKCLDSIYRQVYMPIEIIVMDGGSTDGTVGTLSANSSRISYWKSEMDNGIYYAMNKALKQVTGEWIYFLGADDELLNDFSLLALELRDPYTIYYGSVLKNSAKYLGRLSPYQHAKTGICHQAIIYPKNAFITNKFDERFPISADHVFNMRCWKDHRFKFEFKDFIIAEYSAEGISSVKKDLVFESLKAQLIRKNYGFFIWIRFLFKRLKERLG